VSVGVNQSFVRLALGCIQPASAEQIAAFISSSLPTGAHPLHAEKIREVLDGWASSGDILCVHKRYLLYSLTRQGDGKLSAPERKVRDRTRMFLLKDLRSASLRASEVWGIEQADDSSAVSHGMAVQEDERPIGAAVSPRRRDGRAYWPLLSKQLLVGSSSPSSDTRFRFLSFSSVRSCSQACGYADIPEGGIGLNEISLALGVSPRIVGLLLRRPESHYRVFQIPKAGGGLREIHAPRTFMKVTQHFILGLPTATIEGTPCGNGIQYRLLHTTQRGDSCAKAVRRQHRCDELLWISVDFGRLRSTDSCGSDEEHRCLHCSDLFVHGWSPTRCSD
jgi:hypothetical protein